MSDDAMSRFRDLTARLAMVEAFIAALEKPERLSETGDAKEIVAGLVTKPCWRPTSGAYKGSIVSTADIHAALEGPQVPPTEQPAPGHRALVADLLATSTDQNVQERVRLLLKTAAEALAAPVPDREPATVAEQPAPVAIPEGFEACTWEQALSDGETRGLPERRTGTMEGHYAGFYGLETKVVTWLRPAIPAEARPVAGIDAVKFAVNIWDFAGAKIDDLDELKEAVRRALAKQVKP